MKNLNSQQTKIELEKIFSLSFEICYYDGYVWFISESFKSHSNVIRIDFDELSCFDDSFDLDSFCVSVFDIDAEPVDMLAY